MVIVIVVVILIVIVIVGDFKSGDVGMCQGGNKIIKKNKNNSLEVAPPRVIHSLVYMYTHHITGLVTSRPPSGIKSSISLFL